MLPSGSVWQGHVDFDIREVGNRVGQDWQVLPRREPTAIRAFDAWSPNAPGTIRCGRRPLRRHVGKREYPALRLSTLERRAASKTGNDRSLWNDKSPPPRPLLHRAPRARSSPPSTSRRPATQWVKTGTTSLASSQRRSVPLAPCLPTPATSSRLRSLGQHRLRGRLRALAGPSRSTRPQLQLDRIAPSLAAASRRVRGASSASAL